MANLPDPLLFAEKDLTAFTVRLLTDSASALELRANLLAANLEFLKEQPQPDQARIDELGGALAETRLEVMGARAAAESISKSALVPSAGDRAVSVAVRDADGLPVAAQIRLREQGGKGLTLTATSSDLGDAGLLLTRAQLGDAAARTFVVEAVDPAGQVIATGAAPLTLGEDNLLQIQLTVPAAKPGDSGDSPSPTKRVPAAGRPAQPASPKPKR